MPNGLDRVGSVTWRRWRSRFAGSSVQRTQMGLPLWTLASLAAVISANEVSKTLPNGTSFCQSCEQR